MKMVKSLLLGSAAGVVAIAGAQAADLPVKAKPVEYVKICSLYGDGFFYVPGTETCVRIGASTQGDFFYNARGNGHPHYDAADGAQDRTVSPFSSRGRGDIGLDSRTQTSYGTLRSVVVLRLDNTDQGTIGPNVVRGYIQWAGFTFGHLKGYTDPYGSWGGGGDFKNLHQGQIHDDSGANGTNQIAYTWELGNGMVLIFGADERRVGSIANLSNNSVNAVFTPTVLFGTAPVSSRAGETMPNPYVAFRMSQAWGNFSAAVLLTDNKALYYTAATPGFGNCNPAVNLLSAAPAGQQGGGQVVVGSPLCGRPADKWGFASLNGIEIKTPFLGERDRVGGFVLYGQGAGQYAGGTNVGSPGQFGSGNNISLGVKSDAVYVNGSQLELTTSFTFGGAFEHYWVPNFSTTVFAGRSQTSYDSTVINSRWFCGPGAINPVAPTGAVNPIPVNIGAPQQITGISGNTACDPGFKLWEYGIHTDWYPIPGFRLAVEVGQIFVQTAFKGQSVTLVATGGNGGTAPVVVGKQTPGVYTAKDQGITWVSFKAQRGFGGVGE